MPSRSRSNRNLGTLKPPGLKAEDLDWLNAPLGPFGPICSEQNSPSRGDDTKLKGDSLKSRISPDVRHRLTVQQRQRLDAGIRKKIRHYQRCLILVRDVDSTVFQAGMELFHSESALAEWLSEPTRALGDKIPLAVMRTASGRARVSDLLRAISQGNYL